LLCTFSLILQGNQRRDNEDDDSSCEARRQPLMVGKMKNLSIKSRYSSSQAHIDIITSVSSSIYVNF